MLLVAGKDAEFLKEREIAEAVFVRRDGCRIIAECGGIF